MYEVHRTQSAWYCNKSTEVVKSITNDSALFPATLQSTGSFKLAFSNNELTLHWSVVWIFVKKKTLLRFEPCHEQLRSSMLWVGLHGAMGNGFR